MPKPPGAGQTFMQDTGYSRARPVQGALLARPVPAYKQYGAAVRRLALPRPERMEGMGLWETLARRRSRRTFSGEPLSLGELGQLLWAVSGLTGELEKQLVRTAASAGGLYPNETYVFTHRVADCPSGLAHYDVQAHSLELLAEGDYRFPLASACLGQPCVREAAVVLGWAAVIQRATWKYADRAYRYVLLDAGHLGAHLQLAATALGLGSVNVGAFFDDEVNGLLGLDGEKEFAVYLAAVGKIA